MSTNVCARVTIGGVSFKARTKPNRAAVRPNTAATTTTTTTTPKPAPTAAINTLEASLAFIEQQRGATAIDIIDSTISQKKRDLQKGPQSRPQSRAPLRATQARVIAKPTPKTKGKRKLSSLDKLRAKGPLNSYIYGSQGPAAKAAAVEAAYWALPGPDDELPTAKKRKRTITSDDENDRPMAKRPKSFFFICFPPTCRKQEMLGV